MGNSVAECDEMQFVADRLRQRAVHCAWDVGANIGSWALFLAGLTPQIDEIICFEPDSTNRKFLEMNVSRNRINRIRIEPVALSSHSGEGAFLADEMTGCTGSLEEGHSFINDWYGKKPTEITVPLRTVDEMVAEGTTAPDLMKIDVEGHELSVLQGASQTLGQHRPVLMMEVTRHLPEIDALLSELGYDYFSAVTGEKVDALHREMVAIPR
jgi:FkbM family methyltransferase